MTQTNEKKQKKQLNVNAKQWKKNPDKRNKKLKLNTDGSKLMATKQ